MRRFLKREWLDELPATDPGAIHSRRDLRRLNQWMGHVGIITRALRSFAGELGPVRILELGAGDGDLLLRVAQQLGKTWQGTRASLLDRHNLITENTRRRFAQLGWELEIQERDLLDWCGDSEPNQYDFILANLVLHHFQSDQLKVLLSKVAERSAFFVAVEPRRCRFALLFSRLVGLIGCNAVTRHDAPASVRGGFRGNELSRLWPTDGTWQVCERPAGMFSHLLLGCDPDRMRKQVCHEPP